MRHKAALAGYHWPIRIIMCGTVAALIIMLLTPAEARAEARLYRLRVTLSSGERYETISASDPINYCHMHGGSVIWLRDYSLIYSPEMKVKVLRTWIDPAPDLAGRWRNVLLQNGMPARGNHKPLPRVGPLTLADLQRIE